MKEEASEAEAAAAGTVLVAAAKSGLLPTTQSQATTDAACELPLKLGCQGTVEGFRD